MKDTSVHTAAKRRTSRGDLEVRLRRPTREDVPAIFRMIRNSGVLDLNSEYAYLLQTEHFPATCVVAEVDGEAAGYVSAYQPPQKPDVIFVWQVVVSEETQGMGIGKGMLLELLLREVCESVKYLETTVTPSNEASRAMFESVARKLKTECRAETLFPSEVFIGGSHEEEVLLRIGPFN